MLSRIFSIDKIDRENMEFKTYFTYFWKIIETQIINKNLQIVFFYDLIHNLL